YATAPPEWGSCRSASSRSGCDDRVSTRLGPSEATELTVAQAVVDEDEELARHRGAGDVLPAAVGDAVIVGLEFRAATNLGDRLDRRPPHQLGALLGDLPATHLAVRLSMLGGEPGPRTQRLGCREASDVANLDHEHRRKCPTDTVELLDRL